MCDLSYIHVTATSPQPSSKESHRSFILFTVITAVSLVVIAVVIFVFLQYRSNGHCSISSGSGALLVDGGGVIEYTSLAGKETTLFSAEDGLLANGFDRDEKNYLDYDSD